MLRVAWFRVGAEALTLTGIGSLTITYFHTGIRTIIGVESFHGPVRDGKGWYQLAMVIRHDLLLRRVFGARQPIWEEVLSRWARCNGVMGGDCVALHASQTFSAVPPSGVVFSKC